MSRNKVEIHRDILKAIVQPKKLTHIMYAANVNISVLKPFLKTLIEKELCKKTHNPKLSKQKLRYNETVKNNYYGITEKGLKFLTTLNGVEKAWKELLYEVA